MSSGRVHDKVTWYLLIPFFGLCWGVIGDFFQSFICASSFLFSGLMFGPDLDTKSRQYKRWGIFRFIWIPYQKLGGHRSFLNQSHDSLFGPLIRFCYLLLVTTLLVIASAFCFKLNLTSIYAWLKGHLNMGLMQLIILFFVGSWIGSLSHIFTDWIYTLNNTVKLPFTRREGRRDGSW